MQRDGSVQSRDADHLLPRDDALLYLHYSHETEFRAAMGDITLGHRLARELWGRGDRRRWMRVDQYRDLRRVETVEELADFFDRNGLQWAPVSNDVEAMADAITIERQAPDGVADPAIWGLVFGVMGLLTLPVALVWRFLWSERDGE